MPYVLLVDDDPDGRESLSRLLEHSGYEVASAKDGQDALRSIMSRAPDVIVLDLFMPQMDGVKFLEVIRSYLRLQSLRVVILTAFPESPLVHDARSLGVTHILAKTKSTYEQIEAAIRSELDRQTPPDSNSDRITRDA